MAKIKFRIDLLAPEKFPSEILVGLVREYNEDRVSVTFTSAKECIIEGEKIKIRKRDIEKNLNIDLPLTSDWCNYMTNNTIWQKSVAEIDGKIEATTTELTISLSEKRQVPRTPVDINLIADIKSEKDHENFRGIITNISSGGIGICSSKQLQLDEMIGLSFTFPDIDMKFENVKAIVEWQRSDLQRFGARLVRMKKNEKNLLRYLVNT